MDRWLNAHPPVAMRRGFDHYFNVLVPSIALEAQDLVFQGPAAQIIELVLPIIKRGRARDNSSILGSHDGLQDSICALWVRQIHQRNEGLLGLQITFLHLVVFAPFFMQAFF